MATKQYAFRLPQDLLTKIDAYAGRLRERVPGLPVSRTDVVRMLLIRGLEAAEAEERGEATKKSGRKPKA